MKTLKEYIDEGLISRKVSTKTPIKYKPKTCYELKDIIIDLLRKGITDLNCIDVSGITDMYWLFYVVNKTVTIKDIDISEWNVSNVTDMSNMFFDCTKFNSDLSNWDVSNTIHMGSMFKGCENFNSDLSKWDISKVKCTENMFTDCITLQKNNKIPNWYNG